MTVDAGLANDIVALARGERALAGRDDEPSDAIAALILRSLEQPASVAEDLSRAATELSASADAAPVSELLAAITKLGATVGEMAVPATRWLLLALTAGEAPPRDRLVQVAKAWIECAPFDEILGVVQALPLSREDKDELTLLALRRREPAGLIDRIDRLADLSEPALALALRMYLSKDSDGSRARELRFRSISGTRLSPVVARAIGTVLRELGLAWSGPHKVPRRLPRFGLRDPKAAE
jgi:hypothetical protein